MENAYEKNKHKNSKKEQGNLTTSRQTSERVHKQKTDFP